MPIVSEDDLPVRYHDWAEWRDERLEYLTDLRVISWPLESFCAMCWGQGRILELAPNDEGYVPRPCASCRAPDDR